MSGANSLTRAMWSTVGEAGQNHWKGEAGALPGSEPQGSLQAWHKTEQPMAENSMGRWFKQQGVIFSLLIRRRTHLHPCALPLEALCREQWSYALCQVQHSQGAALNSVVANSAHGFPSQCHGPNTAPDFVVSRNHLLKSGVKTCLLLESVQVQQAPGRAWLKCLCVPDKVGALLILSLLHVHLLGTRGMVVPGINSATPGKM